MHDEGDRHMRSNVAAYGPCLLIRHRHEPDTNRLYSGHGIYPFLWARRVPDTCNAHSNSLLPVTKMPSQL